MNLVGNTGWTVNVSCGHGAHTGYQWVCTAGCLGLYFLQGDAGSDAGRAKADTDIALFISSWPRGQFAGPCGNAELLKELLNRFKWVIQTASMQLPWPSQFSNRAMLLLVPWPSSFSTSGISKLSLMLTLLGQQYLWLRGPLVTIIAARISMLSHSCKKRFIFPF